MRLQRIALIAKVYIYLYNIFWSIRVLHALYKLFELIHDVNQYEKYCTWDS